MDIERLSHLPEKKRRELQRIAQILFDEFDESLKTKLSEKAKRGRILKLILFGSYARGNWVEDRKSGYLSDYDLLIVVNYEQFAEKYDAWEKAAARFAQEFEIAGHLSAPVNFIAHSYQEVNSMLARGWPFFRAYRPRWHPALRSPRPSAGLTKKSGARRSAGRGAMASSVYTIRGGGRKLPRLQPGHDHTLFQDRVDGARFQRMSGQISPAIDLAENASAIDARGCHPCIQCLDGPPR